MLIPFDSFKRTWRRRMQLVLGLVTQRSSDVRAKVLHTIGPMLLTKYRPPPAVVLHAATASAKGAREKDLRQRRRRRDGHESDDEDDYYDDGEDHDRHQHDVTLHELHHERHAMHDSDSDDDHDEYPDDHDGRRRDGRWRKHLDRSAQALQLPSSEEADAQPRSFRLRPSKYSSGSSVEMVATTESKGGV
jgi:hypothetical protein